MLKRVCAFDACCEFIPHVYNQIYCTEHHCKRKAEFARKRINTQSDQFDQPRLFKELTIRSAPEHFRIIILGDLHRPFHDKRVLAAVERFWTEFQPNLEIYAGDIGDLYTISQYDQNPSRRFRLQDEFDDTATWLESRVKANSARRIFIDGNHEDRLRRWLWKYGKELNSLRCLDVEGQFHLKDLGFEHLDYGSVVDLLGYRIEHGYKTTQSKAYPINTSRWMAIATGSSGLCGHTHHFSMYSWTDARGSHSYIENGCLCRMDMEYAPFPNWQHSFTIGTVHRNKLHLTPVPIYPQHGFRAEGEFYAI